MTTKPMITMRMEITIATMGRLMKNLAIGSLLGRAAADGGSARRGGGALRWRCGRCRRWWRSRGCGLGRLPLGLGVRRQRLHLLTGSDLVDALHDDPLARLQPFGDDPEGADALRHLDLADVGR